MSWKICRYVFLISLLLLSVGAWGADKEKASVKAKEPAKEKVPASEDPFFGGVYVSADVFGFIYPIFVPDAFYSMEASMSVDLKHRFYPTVEMGYGYCNTTGELYGIRYATSAPYIRVGMDYNMQYKTGAPSYIFVGARVGTSNAPFEMEAPAFTDPVFGVEVPFHVTDMPCRAIWAETVAGLKAQIAGGFYMGWSIRYKRFIHAGNDKAYGNPWFVPGFGVYGTQTIGATYNLIYYFHSDALFKKK